MLQSLFATDILTKALERRQYRDRTRRVTATPAQPQPVQQLASAPVTARHRWRQLLSHDRPVSA